MGVVGEGVSQDLSVTAHYQLVVGFILVHSTAAEVLVGVGSPPPQRVASSSILMVPLKVTPVLQASGVSLGTIRARLFGLFMVRWVCVIMFLLTL